jgi:hypothetical protein
MVVDNASQDDSASMVRAEFPGVQIFRSEINLGFAKANNLAMARASGRYLLFLNPDTIVHESAPQRLISFLEAHPLVAVAGPRLVFGDGSFQHSAFRFPSLAQSFLDFFPTNHRLIDSHLNGRYPKTKYEGEPFPVDHPLGACFLVRREAVDGVGPFDEGFFMYCEEVDWCIRLRRAGWEICCVPEAVVTHFGAQSTRQFRERMFVELFRSRLRLFRKHYSPAYVFAARQIIRLGLRREARRAQAAFRRGEIDRTLLDKRLSAYREVAAL